MSGETLDPLDFVHSLIARETLHPDGTRDVERAAAVWILAHRGYSGRGRLDLWVYPTKKKALQVGAKPAMGCGPDEDERARDLYERGKYEKVLEAYEQSSPDYHLLRVVAAWFQDDP